MKRPPYALLAILTLVGFLLVVTASATTVANQRQEPRRNALIDQIMQERRNVSDLDKAVEELHGQLEDARADVGRLSADQAATNAARQKLALQAGDVAVKGPGITVKLSDAPRQPGDTDIKFDASRIQDSDIQLIVNALFAVGAEAVAVNDNRVVSVTPIRAAGGTIVVNYRPVTSPYRIVAIGADERRFNETDIADHFRQWEKKFDLGFDVDKSKDLSVPPYAGRVSIDIAQPLDEHDTSTVGP